VLLSLLGLLTTLLYYFYNDAAHHFNNTLSLWNNRVDGDWGQTWLMSLATWSGDWVYKSYEEFVLDNSLGRGCILFITLPQ
jgi:hypothetical protein